MRWQIWIRTDQVGISSLPLTGWEASTDVLLLVLFDFSVAFKWLIELAPHRRVVRVRSCPAAGRCWACQQVLSVTEACTGVPGSCHKELFFLHLILRSREERQTHVTRQPKRVSGRLGSGCLRVTSHDGLIPDEENIRLRDRVPMCPSKQLLFCCASVPGSWSIR